MGTVPVWVPGFLDLHTLIVIITLLLGVSSLHHHICLVTFLPNFTCQAERELQPWIAKDDDLGQQMWRINQRIVKLIAELIRNHDIAESLVILASNPDLLLRATDGMLVDGETCTLPQLEVMTYLDFWFSGNIFYSSYFSPDEL
uniref:Protein GIGANTEA n=1 Tax=Solanum tuberosum TaxID=4113 RepID=M1BMC1_SOLTU